MPRWLGRIEARLPRIIRPTREGTAYVIVTLGAGVAAINTGNNLLYLVFGMLLCLIVASGVLSEIALRDLDVRRHVPARIFAGRLFLMGIGLTNRKRRFSSFSVEIEDLLEGQPLRKRCFFLKIPPGRSQQTSYRHQFARRGLYRLTAFRISTRYPFALFRKWRDVTAPTEAVVFPAPWPIPAADLLDANRSGDEPTRRRGRTGEFAGLRPAERDDDARDIHWRASARVGRLMVREHEDEQLRSVVVVLDNAAPPGAPHDSRDDPAFERAVAYAAALVIHHAARGFAVGLGARGLVIPPAAGEAQVGRVLRALALIGWAAPDTPIPALPRAARRVIVGRTAEATA